MEPCNCWVQCDSITLHKSQRSSGKMKAVLAIALVATLTVAASAFKRVQCPEENGEDVVLLPNPQDCTTYYSCDNGIAYLMRCNEGLHFNVEERVCDWPEQARCESSADLPNGDNNDDNHNGNDDIQYVNGEEPSLQVSIPESSNDNGIGRV